MILTWTWHTVWDSPVERHLPASQSHRAGSPSAVGDNPVSCHIIFACAVRYLTKHEADLRRKHTWNTQSCLK